MGLARALRAVAGCVKRETHPLPRTVLTTPVNRSHRFRPSLAVYSLRAVFNRLGGNTGMKRYPWLLSIAVLASAVGLLYAQASLTGYWVFRVSRGDGTFNDSFFELNQEGETISGRAIRGSGEAPISEGTLKDGKLHFVVSIPGRAGAVTRVVYDGESSASGKFALTVTGGRPASGDFQPSTKEAALPPARIVPPALHDVHDNGLVRTPP